MPFRVLTDEERKKFYAEFNKEIGAFTKNLNENEKRFRKTQDWKLLVNYVVSSLHK